MLIPRVHTCYCSAWIQQHRGSIASRLVGLALSATFVIWVAAWHFIDSEKATTLQRPHNLVKSYIEDGRGDGGRWYLPSEWLGLDNRFLQPYTDIEHYMDIRNPRSPAEAAQLALELSMRRNLYLQNTKIPLIVHQTWKDVDAASWSSGARDSVEAWLKVATGETYPELPKMAYILWDDSAVDALIELYEPEMWPEFQKLPRPVEKADIFRVAVLKWFGGVYVDIDTEPLRHPYQWVQEEDTAMWTDPTSKHDYYLYEPLVKSYQPPESAPFRPHPYPESPSDNTPASYKNSMTHFAPSTTDVGAIFGLEADTPVDANDYWRAGYSYPVQLTNWALAMAPHHPVANHFVPQVLADIKGNVSSLAHVDPLDLTGPPALTRTIKEWTECENPHFTWESVTGLKDDRGGRGKVVAGDIMILPITGFSPGRGMWHRMGSEPITHPNARLRHLAQGSWRHTSVRVQMGKTCRTLFGLCRDWSKVDP